MEWMDKNGNPLKKGDVVEWGDGHKGTVIELSSFGIRVQGYGMRGLEEWSGSSSQVRNVSNSCTSTNPIVQNALAARNMTDGAEIDERDVKAGKYREYWVTREPSMNPSGWTYRAFTYKPMLVRGMELVNSSAANAEVRVGLHKLLHSLSKAKSDIGASLQKFNKEDWGDEYKWAQKVNKACDNVARSINDVVRALDS